jgi:hypothetical protein
MTKEFTAKFQPDGKIEWLKLIELVSKKLRLVCQQEEKLKLV